MQNGDNNKHEALEDRIDHILEEARMVLPGIQTLLGFQLIAVFNKVFTELEKCDQYAHLLAICLSINAICLLLTPAALHRIYSPNEIDKFFVKTASGLVCAGMMPLLVSMVIDSYVVFKAVTQNNFLSASVAFVLMMQFVYCWVIMPELKRRESGKKARTPEC